MQAAQLRLPVQRVGHQVCIVQRLKGVHRHNHRQLFVASTRQAPPGARQINDRDGRHACKRYLAATLPRPGLFGPSHWQVLTLGSPWWAVLIHPARCKTS